jgi:hypothetical protein
MIVNSCLERHLPHGLLFVIANSTSILHVCLNVIAMILCSAWHKSVKLGAKQWSNKCQLYSLWFYPRRGSNHGLPNSRHANYYTNDAVQPRCNVYQKPFDFGQWHYITKLYPVNAICLLKQNKFRIKVIIIHVNSEFPINTDTCQKISRGIVLFILNPLSCS